MHEVDSFGGDDALKARHIERHRERVLGRRGKANVQAPDRLQLARQLAGIGRHERARAGLRQSGGDGERRALVAAGVNGRDDLEDRSAGERRVRPAPKGRKRVDAHAKLRHDTASAGPRGRLTSSACSAKPARPRASKPALVQARSAGRIIRSELNLSDGQPQFFIVGEFPNQRRIAFRRRAPVRSGGPSVIWLSGYRSEMELTKATALDAEAERRGLGLLRFDYSGHGRSDGRIEEGTISRWLEETLAIVRAESEGPQILVGSSMGGYLALLAARALHEAGETGRIKGLILIAPAVDFTEALIWARAPDEARRAIIEKGAWREPSAYSSEPDCFTRDLIEDGRKHLLLGGMIRTRAPDGRAARHAGRGCALRPRARAHGSTGRRPGDADADQGRRSQAVAPAGFAAAVRRAGQDGVRARRLPFYSPSRKIRITPTSRRSGAGSRRGP